MNQYEVWIADLNPRLGTETGNIRPVSIVQTDLLNNVHPSTVICPLSSNIQPESNILRIHLTKGVVNLEDEWGIMVDQLRAIDNRRFQKKIGKIPEDTIKTLKENIKVLLYLSE
jgi:mRNA interferase MazF